MAEWKKETRPCPIWTCQCDGMASHNVSPANQLDCHADCALPSFAHVCIIEFGDIMFLFCSSLFLHLVESIFWNHMIVIVFKYHRPTHSYKYMEHSK